MVLEEKELEKAKALGVKAVIIGAVGIPFYLITLHFLAAAFKIDFSILKEGELMLACIAAIALVAKFAFGSKKDA